MTLAQRLLALHAAFEDAGLQHAFGGAIALAYWTEEPRGTRDLDVNVLVAQHEARRVLDALRTTHRSTSSSTTPPSTPTRPPTAGPCRRGRADPGAQPGRAGRVQGDARRTKDWADIEAMLAAGTLDARRVRDHLLALVGADDARVARLDDRTASSVPAHRRPA